MLKLTSGAVMHKLNESQISENIRFSKSSLLCQISDDFGSCFAHLFHLREFWSLFGLHLWHQDVSSSVLSPVVQVDIGMSIIF